MKTNEKPSFKKQSPVQLDLRASCTGDWFFIGFSKIFHRTPHGISRILERNLIRILVCGCQANAPAAWFNLLN